MVLVAVAATAMLPPAFLGSGHRGWRRSPRPAMDSRAVIEQAKGIVMGECR
ncbi:ANTAR domain-containing protein [Micromonospora sp. 4G55]|uniref:ANTAR domain-containing protein n=1 Tax=Micromonospora sp. 4G55 TaxID=2806102 RepID=UPI001A4AB578|nr:ANTAR domain-containing protein [Micromonospora sp. 4G55]MBM0257821.1 ANTAR domain-containing protein [Micromonospora sp. 4G55]